MGSKSLFSLSTIMAMLASTIIVATPTSAMSQLPDGTNVWTVDELLDVNHEMTIERNFICGEDENCQREIYASQITRGGIYNAVDSMNRETLLVTSIMADDLGVFKVLFHEQDLNEWLISGIHVSHQPKEMLFATIYGDVDPGSEEYLNAIRIGYDPSGQVQFIYGASFAPELGDVFPSDEERTMYTSFMSYYLADNPRLHYTLMNEDWRYDGVADYSACGDAIWYSECKLVFDETGQYRYAPAISLMAPGSITTEPETTDNPEEPNSPDDPNLPEEPTPSIDPNLPEEPNLSEEPNLPDEPNLPEEPNLSEEPNLPEEPVSPEASENNPSDTTDTTSTTEPDNPTNSTHPTTTDGVDINNQNNDTITMQTVINGIDASNKPTATTGSVVEKVSRVKAPETGALEEGKDHVVELPWWLVVIFALGGTTLFWLFVPIEHKKIAKNQKNSKKSKK